MVEELWKSIIGFEHYAVSNLGRVRSMDRTVLIDGKFTYTKHLKGRVLRGKAQTSGHLGVSLSVDGVITQVRVHSVVAEAFLGPCPDGLEVCHDNGIPNDNRASNIRYGTRQENSLDTYLHRGRPVNEDSHLAKYSNELVEQIRLLKGKMSSYLAAELHGVKPRWVRNIWSNEIRKHAP